MYGYLTVSWDASNHTDDPNLFRITYPSICSANFWKERDIEQTVLLSFELWMYYFVVLCDFKLLDFIILLIMIISLAENVYCVTCCYCKNNFSLYHVSMFCARVYVPKKKRQSSIRTFVYCINAFCLII